MSTVSDNILHGPEPLYEPVKGGLGYEIFQMLKLNTGKVALTIVATEETVTYDDLLDKSIKIAIHLAEKKLSREDIVGILSENTSNSMIPFIVTQFIGLKYVAIEPSIPEEDLLYLLEYLPMKIIFVSEKFEKKLEEYLSMGSFKCEIIVLGKSQKFTDLSKLLEISEGIEAYQPVHIDDIKEDAVICLSSGTTGKPKGICISHYALLGQVFNQFIFFGKGTFNLSNFSYSESKNSDRMKFLIYTPSNWISSILIHLTTFFAGGSIILGTTFDAKDVWFAIKKYMDILLTLPMLGFLTNNCNYKTRLFLGICQFQKDKNGMNYKSDAGKLSKIHCNLLDFGKFKETEDRTPNILFLPPGQANELCSYALDKEHISRLYCFLTGGGLVSKIHMENISKCFPEAVNTQCFGLTETVGPISSFCVNRPVEVEWTKKYPESCGRISSGVRIKIVDPDNETICGVGMPGELRVRNKFLMNGFYKMDSSLVFDSDGWFKSGDLAYFDENGLIYILDRIRDILLYKTYNIRPAVIEKILYEHPAVHESLVIGYPHPDDNELPMGIVVLKDEYKNKINADELIAYVDGKVPSDRYKIRAGIKFVDEFMKTVTGKPKKCEMKKLIIEGKF